MSKMQLPKKNICPKKVQNVLLPLKIYAQKINPNILTLYFSFSPSTSELGSPSLPKSLVYKATPFHKPFVKATPLLKPFVIKATPMNKSLDKATPLAIEASASGWPGPNAGRSRAREGGLAGPFVKRNM